MKKYVIMGCVWLGVMISVITCNSKAELSYQIRYDAKAKTTYEVKKKIQDIYADLVQGVHEESYILMVLHNLDRFAYEDGIQAEWKDHRLVIIQGDGKGDVIEGYLEVANICMPQVKPRSLLEELFG